MIKTVHIQTIIITPIKMLHLCFSTRERLTLMPQLPGQRRTSSPNKATDSKARTTLNQRKDDDASVVLLFQRLGLIKCRAEYSLTVVFSLDQCLS